MPQKETHRDRTENSSPFNMIPAEFSAVGKQALDEFIKIQTELLDNFRETNREWLDRAQSQAHLAADFSSKWTAAHSIPEAMAACQEWSSRRLEMMAQDGKQLVADTQKFMATTARLLWNGWLTNGGGGSST